EADFEAGAHGPAGVADAAARQDRHGGVDVAEREPAGDVRQEAVEGQAEPPARGGEPLVAGLAAPRAQHGGRAFDARPVDVAFRAEHRLAELPVVADGAPMRPPDTSKLSTASHWEFPQPPPPLIPR